MSVDYVWGKWKRVFEKHETGDLIDPDTGKLYKEAPRFTYMKPLMREFFRAFQGMSETDIGKAAFHILHVEVTSKRCWVHLKIVFTKPKNFVPSCYTMKEWAENKKKRRRLCTSCTSWCPRRTSL
jgi:hypothetical protein